MRLLSATEVAELLGIELDTLYRYARARKIPGLKIGKLWRFSETDVQAFLDARRVGAVAEAAAPFPRLLTDLLPHAIRLQGDPGGIVFGARKTAYAQIDSQANRVAAALVAGGVAPGDRVAVLLPNSVEFVVAVFGVWKARAVLVADDCSIRPDNLRHILTDAKPAALIIDRGVAVQLEAQRDLLAGVRIALVRDREFALSGSDDLRVDSLEAVLDSDLAPARPFADEASPNDVVSITYTSGSTGRPKGVMHTHDSWLASIEFTADNARLSGADKMMLPLPLHHGYAFRQLLTGVYANATVMIADLYQALKLLREQRPSALVLVPTACNIVLDHFAPILREAGAHLRYVEIGSAALAPERYARLRELLPATQLYLPYGLTEARVAFLEAGPDGLLNRIASISPGLELAVRGADGQPAKPGESGEIVLRGRGLMRGYWGQGGAGDDPAATGFRTGDMGRVDEDGRVALLGRLDDMLKIGGRKVNPQEVEMAFGRHPAVSECAVVALRDPQGVLELVLHAFVVLNKGQSVDEAELLAHCRRLVEPYKVPAQIHFRSSLPKSSVGKILRHAMVAEPMDRRVQVNHA